MFLSRLTIRPPKSRFYPFFTAPLHPPDLSPFPSHFVRTLIVLSPHLFLSHVLIHTDANTLKLIHKTSMYNHLLLSTVCECFSEVSFFYTPPLPSFLLPLFISLSLSLFLSHPSALFHPHFDENFISCERVPKYGSLPRRPRSFLTPRAPVIVLLVRASICVCVYQLRV